MTEVHKNELTPRKIWRVQVWDARSERGQLFSTVDGGRRDMAETLTRPFWTESREPVSLPCVHDAGADVGNRITVTMMGFSPDM